MNTLFPFIKEDLELIPLATYNKTDEEILPLTTMFTETMIESDMNAGTALNQKGVCF